MGFIALLTVSLTGLIAGASHVLAGPDHLAAIAPLAVDARRRPWLTGLFWGLGHTSGVWIVAALALLLRELLPLEWLSSQSERLVGIVLIGIGLWGLRRALRTRVHAHAHEHHGSAHVHVHLHDSATTHEHPHAHAHTHSALAVGTLHGLAGTSHLMGVLPSLALPTRTAALAYVVCFGFGSIIAMAAFAWIMGGVVRRYAAAGTRAYRLLLSGCALAAIAIGVFWLVASGH